MVSLLGYMYSLFHLSCKSDDGVQAAEWISELCSELPEAHGLPDFLLSDSGPAAMSTHEFQGIH